ncbi:hypothetical protein [Nibrella saemangeumensis]
MRPDIVHSHRHRDQLCQRGLYLLSLTVWLLSGCMTTRIVSTADCDTPVNDPTTQRVVTSYFWGLKQPVNLTPGCDPRSNHLNSVTVKSNLGYFLLSAVTLGMVNKQRVEWCCTPFTPRPDTLATR